MTAAYPDVGDFLQSTKLQEIMDDFSVYTKTKSASNKTMAYWLLYIQMVQILLLFIRATRENDWQLHLSAVRSMLPWFFAADRVNYARFGSMYWFEMISLDKTHPGIRLGQCCHDSCFPTKRFPFLQYVLKCFEFQQYKSH